MKKKRSKALLRWLLVPAAAGIIALASAVQAQAPSSDVFRVEQDWQLVLLTPDASLNGPQVTCVISPLTTDDAYCAFDLNYHTQPDYSAGGLQMHVWDPDDPMLYTNFPESGMMRTPGETVTWTQAMWLNAGVLSFQVNNGQSQTWGKFGGTGNAQLSVNTSLPNLNGYDTNVSLTNSGVSFASNLVNSLTLVAVRWYDANGKLIQQDTTPQVVHPQ
ncbi:MAG TPA: hypothetical protein VFW87_04400 [Pirellulales bacterium]|nr:hypothetical protein [Pirellulales bacterium]